MRPLHGPVSYGRPHTDSLKEARVVGSGVVVVVVVDVVDVVVVDVVDVAADAAPAVDELILTPEHSVSQSDRRENLLLLPPHPVYLNSRSGRQNFFYQLSGTKWLHMFRVNHQRMEVAKFF